jgi:hypothetical protein
MVRGAPVDMSNKGSSGSGMKKDEDDFDPGMLNDVAGWLRTLHLHKYMRAYDVEGHGRHG